MDPEVIAACELLGIPLPAEAPEPDTDLCSASGCGVPLEDASARWCPRHRPIFEGARHRSRLLPREQVAELATAGWSSWSWAGEGG